MNLKLQQHIETNLSENFSTILNCSWHQIGGGSINNTYKITSEFHAFFVKINNLSVFENGFKEEVLGLQFLEKNTHKKFFFIGFNALNKAESTLFQAFLEQDRATIFWDLDHFFYQDHN